MRTVESRIVLPEISKGVRMTVSSIQVETVVDSVFEENAYIVNHRPGGECWVIDPSFTPQPQRIISIVSDRGLRPAAILVTHTHGDHIVGIDELCRQWPDAQLGVPASEASYLTDPDKNLSSAFGFNLVIKAEPTRLLKPGDTLSLEGLECQVRDVSGHSPGGVAFYFPAAKVVFTGDALFAGSVGRTDFPGASETQLLNNIREQLLSMPDETIVYAGHGPSTTIGQERRTNPFLRM